MDVELLPVLGTVSDLDFRNIKTKGFGFLQDHIFVDTRIKNKAHEFVSRINIKSTCM